MHLLQDGCTIKPAITAITPDPRNELEPMDGDEYQGESASMSVWLICWLMFHWCTARAERELTTKQYKTIIIIVKQKRDLSMLSPHTNHQQ